MGLVALFFSRVMSLVCAWYSERAARQDFLRTCRLLGAEKQSRELQQAMMPLGILQQLQRINSASSATLAAAGSAFFSSSASATATSMPLPLMASIIAHKREEASVLLSDVVGFASLSSRLSGDLVTSTSATSMTCTKWRPSATGTWCAVGC